MNPKLLKLLNPDLLEKDNAKEVELSKAFDSATLSGKLVTLNEEQAETFVDLVVGESKLLSKVNVVKMKKPNKSIGTLDALGKFLRPGASGVKLTEAQYQQFKGATIDLVSKMVRGAFLITDEEMQDNIEGSNINSKMAAMVAKKVSNELEEAIIYARKRTNPLTTNGVFDGVIWRLYQNGNIVDATDSAVFSDRYVSRDKFVKMLKVIPTKWRGNQKFLNPDDVNIDYNELYNNGFNRSEMINSILGKELLDISLMTSDRPVLVSGGQSTTVNGAITADGTVAALTVASGTGFTAGMTVVVGMNTVHQETYIILSVSTNLITFTEPIRESIPNGTTLKQCTLDGATSILIDPMNIIVGMQTGENGISFETERVASIGYVYHFKMRLDTNIVIPKAGTLALGMKIK